MHLDAVDLKDFYACPLGLVVRKLLGTRLRARWGDLKDCRTFGLGYATPFLAHFRGEAEPLGALMPANLGAVLWPLTLSVVTGRTTLIDWPAGWSEPPPVRFAAAFEIERNTQTRQTSLSNLDTELPKLEARR